MANSNAKGQRVYATNIPDLIGGRIPVDSNVTINSVTATQVKILGSDGTSLAPVTNANGVYADVRASVLPTGAATAAKQPALGTAGAASTDVITVQGIASGTAQPISAASLPLPASAATSTKQSDGSQKSQVVDGAGNVIGATANALDVNIKSGNATTMASTQSGTWTVQPGNTANTTAWKVDGSAVTQPVSIASTVTVSGTVAANPAVGTLVSSTAYEASKVLKASAGTLSYLSGYNSGPAQFIQLFNSTTVPANGAAPVKVLPVAAQSGFSVDVSLTGIPFTVGISVSNSSTGPTKTLGSSDIYFTAVVI